MAAFRTIAPCAAMFYDRSSMYRKDHVAVSLCVSLLPHPTSQPQPFCLYFPYVTPNLSRVRSLDSLTRFALSLTSLAHLLAPRVRLAAPPPHSRFSLASHSFHSQDSCSRNFVCPESAHLAIKTSKALQNWTQVWGALGFCHVVLGLFGWCVVWPFCVRQGATVVDQDRMVLEQHDGGEIQVRGSFRTIAGTIKNVKSVKAWWDDTFGTHRGRLLELKVCLSS